MGSKHPHPTGAVVSRRIRRESRPLGLELLTDSQLDVADQLTDLLTASIDLHGKVARTDTDTTMSFLDPVNPNRSFFCSGKRGSGKTSLMITLVNELDPRRGNSHGADSDKIAADEKGDDRADKIRKIRSGLRSIGDRVVPLETLDMEPLAQLTNLFSAILARLDNAAREELRIGADNLGSGQELLAMPPGPERALNNLARLQAEVAMSWDVAEMKLGMSSDPDVFATTVRRMEAARLSINSRLNEVVEELAATCFGRRQPIFLLLVDDFDLAPGRGVDLLKLLRMISVPRVLTLIFGDVDQLEEMLALKNAANLQEVGGGVAESALGRHADIGRVAGSIATASRHKLIPESHTIRINPLKYDAAKAFDPQRYDPTAHGEGRTLGELFEKSPIDVDLLSGKHAPTLATLLEVDDFKKRDDLERGSSKGDPGPCVGDSAVYPGGIFFETYPRHLTDIWLQLDTIENAHTNDPNQHKAAVLDWLISAFRRAVAEDENLNSSVRTSLKEAVYNGFDGRWRMNTDRIRCSSGRGGRQRVSVHSLPVLVASRPTDWAFFVEDHAGGQHRLQERTAASLLLLHDVLALGRPRGVTDLDLIQQQNGSGWANVSWRVGSEVDIYWPSVPWRSFWSYSKLRASWCWTWDRLREVRKNDVKDDTDLDDLERLRAEVFAYCWIADSTCILWGNEVPEAANVMLTSSQMHKYVLGEDDCLEWESLGKKISSWLPKASAIERREVMWLQWGVRLGALVCPEFGLPVSVAVRILQSWSPLRANWATHAALVREVRAEKFAYFEEKGVREVGLMLVAPGDLIQSIRQDASVFDGLAQDERSPKESPITAVTDEYKKLNRRLEDTQEQAQATMKELLQQAKSKRPELSKRLAEHRRQSAAKIRNHADSVDRQLTQCQATLVGGLAARSQDVQQFNEAQRRVQICREFADLFARSLMHPMNVSFENHDWADGSLTDTSKVVSFCPSRTELETAVRVHRELRAREADARRSKT